MGNTCTSDVGAVHSTVNMWDFLYIAIVALWIIFASMWIKSGNMPWWLAGGAILAWIIALWFIIFSNDRRAFEIFVFFGWILAVLGIGFGKYKEMVKQDDA